jgi:hypothetical protein
LGYNPPSKENRKIVLLNLLSTAIWYSYAWVLKFLLEIIKGYTMPTYVIHIGFVLVILILNMWFGLSLNKKINTQTCNWIQDYGIWQHKTTGLYYCSYCAPNPSPLSTDNNKSWFCHKCNNGFGKGEVFTVD